MSNSGKATLENSIKGDIDLELIGNSVQPTTTGKNLFDPKQLQGISGFTIEGNEITQSGYNVSTGKTLKQLCPEITPGTYILSANNGEFTGLFGITKPMYKKSAIEIVEEDLNRIVSLVGNPNKTIKYTLQIEKGNTVTPYEPYTGGKPSPSPEYQQEIKSAGKWNEEKQKHEIDIKVTGKNLFDLTKIKNGFVGSAENGFSVVQDNRFPSSVYLDMIIPLKAGQTLNISGVEQDTCRIRVKYDTGVYYLKYTANKDAEIMICFHSGLSEDDKRNLMVEISDEPTSYEPYQEPQILTLTSDRPITKWDKLVEQGGQYGWLYQSEVKEYRGENSVSLYDSGFYFLLNNKNITKGEGYCSELKQHVPYEKNPCISFNIASNTYAYTLNTQEIYGSTVSEIKEYLKSHPLHLVYKTEATEFITLSQEEQTQLRNLHSYNGATNITVDSGEVPCGIKVVYKQKK